MTHGLPHNPKLPYAYYERIVITLTINHLLNLLFQWNFVFPIPKEVEGKKSLVFVTKPSNVTVPISCTSAKYAQKNSVMFLLYHKLIETRQPFVEKNLICI